MEEEQENFFLRLFCVNTFFIQYFLLTLPTHLLTNNKKYETFH